MKKALKQIVEIRSGYQFRGTVKATDKGNVRVIQIKDITGDGELQPDDFESVHIDAPQRHLVRQGDVLFLSRGRQMQATLISEPLQGVVAVSYFFILTPSDEMVLPGFLAWALNHSQFQRRVAELVQTTSVPWISKNDFENLKLDVPPLEVQHQIVELVTLHARQKQLVSQLASKREQLVDAVCKQLISGEQ